MANTPQAKKRVRQAETKRKHNASMRSMTRTAVKKTMKAIHAGHRSDEQTHYVDMQKTLDRMATRGLISPNKAARHKSQAARLAKRLDSQSA